MAVSSVFLTMSPGEKRLQLYTNFFLFFLVLIQVGVVAVFAGSVLRIIPCMFLTACRWLFEWMTIHGYPLKIVPYNEWLSK